MYPHGSAICTEGQVADCLYIVVAGNVVVHTRAHGRLANLEPGSHFGEMGILVNQSWRTATVRADSDSCIDGNTECFSLHRRDVHHLLASDRCAAALAEARAVYEQRVAARQSERVSFMVDQFFDVLAVSESTNASPDETARVQKRGVSQGAYTRLHMLVTKVLPSGLSDEDAQLSALNDWAGDVVSFETGEPVNAALEVAKAQLRDLMARQIQHEGWCVIIEDRIGADAFLGVCREELGVKDTDLDDQALADIFVQAESSFIFGAGLRGREFASWLSKVCDDHVASVRTPISSAAVALRRASEAEITKCGWDRAFSHFSTDGMGEVQFEEFAALTREFSVEPPGLPRSTLRQIFRYLDSSRSGRISSAQVSTWIEYAPMEQLMSIKSLKEGLLQLSQLWIEQVDAVDAESPDRDYYFLQWLFEAVTCVDGDGGDDGSRRRLRRLDELDEDRMQNAEEPAQADTSNSSALVEPDVVQLDSEKKKAELTKRPKPPKPTRKRREPLFISPRVVRAASPKHSDAKGINPNRIIFHSKLRLGKSVLTSNCYTSIQHDAAPSEIPLPTEQATGQGDELSAVVIKVAAPEDPVHTDPRDQWSIKHHPASSRQARRTTGSGRLLGRTEHTPPPRVVNLSVQPNSCSGWQGPAYVGDKSGSTLQRPAIAGGSRSVHSKHVSLSASVDQPQLSKYCSTAKDIVFDRTEVANNRVRQGSRPASASPSTSARHRQTTAKQPHKAHSINRSKRPATAPVRCRAVERAGEDLMFELSSTLLAAAAKEPGSTAFNERAGIRERTRPASVARAYVIGVQSRGPMRSGRPNTRPLCPRPHREMVRQMNPTHDIPRLTRDQVDVLIECGGFQYGAQDGATLTEF